MFYLRNLLSIIQPSQESLANVVSNANVSDTPISSLIRLCIIRLASVLAYHFRTPFDKAAQRFPFQHTVT